MPQGALANRADGQLEFGRYLVIRKNPRQDACGFRGGDFGPEVVGKIGDIVDEHETRKPCEPPPEKLK
jgi:hypothetical protein